MFLVLHSGPQSLIPKAERKRGVFALLPLFCYDICYANSYVRNEDVYFRCTQVLCTYGQGKGYFVNGCVFSSTIDGTINFNYHYCLNIYHSPQNG